MIYVLALSVGAQAELSFLHDDEWLGCFAVHESQRFNFAMRAKGEMLLIPKQRDKDPVAELNRIKIQYGIEEVKPNGDVVMKEIRDDSLVSEQSATDSIRQLVVHGDATGGAKFELVIEQSRDVISLGGRILDAGKLKKYPLRFTVRVVIPNVYRRVEIEDHGDQRMFDKRTRRDYLDIKRVDGSRVKLTSDDAEALDGNRLSGSGIESVEMRLSYYEGRRFHFAASPHSGMAVSDGERSDPWYEGMILHWWPDSGKDPEGRSRLKFCVK